MTETMEQYMSKTRGEYESGVARPKIDSKAQFELKGQFLKELRGNTFSGSEHEDANEHIEKVLEIVDLFHIPDITQDQIMLHAFHVSLTGAANRWLRNEPSGSITTWEEVILFYNGLDVPKRQILDSRGAIPTKTVADAKVAIQEMVECSQKWHNGTSSKSKSTETSDGLAAIQAQLNSLGREIKKVNEKVYAAQRNNGNSSYPARRETMEESLSKFMTESAKRHEEKSNIIKEIRASTGATIRNQGASIKTLELQIKQMSKIRRMETSPYAVPVPQHRYIFPETVPFPKRLHNYCCDDLKEAHEMNILDAIDHNMPQKEKDPGSFTLPCFIKNVCFDKALVDLGASVSVMPFSTYINLVLGVLSHTRLTIELTDRTIKQPRDIAENVLVRIGKFVFPIDFIILDIPEDDDVPLILGRPFLSTAHVKIDVFKRKVTLRVGEEKLVFKSIKPASSMIKRVFMDE
ncbi:retrovirus-related pol polyprotein from transposon TNT 1-94 [Tanacetum coccineum]